MAIAVHPLSPEVAPHAWPLVREIEGAATLDDWLAFVRRADGMRPSDGGFMVCDVDGYLRGLFHWRISRDVGGQRQLIVNHFTVAGTLPSRSVTEALLDRIELLAGELECGGTAIEMPLGTDIGASFAARGHRLSHVSWSRKARGAA